MWKIWILVTLVSFGKVLLYLSRIYSRPSQTLPYYVFSSIYSLWLQAVHTSGAIRPSNTEDSRERCGSVLCERVDEIFSQTKLNFGYNYITTIPAGAMNLSIHEMAKSDNMLGKWHRYLRVAYIWKSCQINPKYRNF